jgi:hypothetical protein
VTAVKRLLRCVERIAVRENLLEMLRFAHPQAKQNVVLSEAFTLSLQRIARSSANAFRRPRCNDSVNGSLSAAFDRAVGLGGSRVRFNGPRRADRPARGAWGPPNKPMQRTVETTASFLQAQRAAADRQR